MENNTCTTFAGGAQHQQRLATTALEQSLQRQLSTAHAAGRHFDLEVFLGLGMKCHLRVTEVGNGLLTGLMLFGFRGDSPRRCGGASTIRISRIMMIEEITATGSYM